MAYTFGFISSLYFVEIPNVSLTAASGLLHSSLNLLLDHPFFSLSIRQVNLRRNPYYSLLQKRNRQPPVLLQVSASKSKNLQLQTLSSTKSQAESSQQAAQQPHCPATQLKNCDFNISTSESLKHISFPLHQLYCVSYLQQGSHETTALLFRDKHFSGGTPRHLGSTFRDGVVVCWSFSKKQHTGFTSNQTISVLACSW